MNAMAARAFRFSALFAIVVSLVLCVASPCRASDSSSWANETGRTQEEEKAAGRFDVFGDLRDCDLGARLDNFAINLMNEATMKGHAIVYSGKYDLPQRVLAYRERIGDYLVNSRGVEPSRLTVVDGGYREEMTIELWVVPKGAAVPEPTETIDATKELDKAFKFEEQYISVPIEELGYEVEDFELMTEVTEETAPVEANTDEQPIEEQTDEAEASAQDEEVQAAPGETEREEEADADVWWSLKAYARALDIEKKARGHIIFYADREAATFSKVQANVEQAVAQLAKKYGVKAERLTMTFGGYRREPTAELWILPVNVSLPVPTPEPEVKDNETKNQAALQHPSAP
ncbi:MAG: hypothetical protein ICV68_08805 [Pyrinomonadaceae bacterium]|nr:hypothetical protein [Pyrinomonadaceae bacterium]